MSYSKGQAPHLATSEVGRRLDAVLNFVDVELLKIQIESRQPEVRALRFEVNYTVPAKYREGDLVYFEAGVVGGQAGLYVREGANWRKL